MHAIMPYDHTTAPSSHHHATILKVSFEKIRLFRLLSKSQSAVDWDIKLAQQNHPYLSMPGTGAATRTTKGYSIVFVFLFFFSFMMFPERTKQTQKHGIFGEDCSFPLASIWIFQWLPLLPRADSHCWLATSAIRRAWVCEEINAKYDQRLEGQRKK